MKRILTYLKKEYFSFNIIIFERAGHRGQMSMLSMRMLITVCLAGCKCQILTRCLENYFQALHLMSRLQIEPLFWRIYDVYSRDCYSCTLKVGEPGFKTPRSAWVSWGSLKKLTKLSSFMPVLCHQKPPGHFALSLDGRPVSPNALHPLPTVLGAPFPMPSPCSSTPSSCPLPNPLPQNLYFSISRLAFNRGVVVFSSGVWLFSPSEVPEGFSPLDSNWDVQVFIWALWNWWEGKKPKTSFKAPRTIINLWESHQYNIMFMYLCISEAGDQANI